VGGDDEIVERIGGDLDGGVVLRVLEARGQGVFRRLGDLGQPELDLEIATRRRNTESREPHLRQRPFPRNGGLIADLIQLQQPRQIEDDGLASHDD
jgi:hypothetical protein